MSAASDMDKIHQEYLTQVRNAEIVAALLEQQGAHNSMVSALRYRIELLEKENEERSNETFLYFLFFFKLHQELVPELVEFAYKEMPKSAKKIINAFHDEALDLSTLECTGDDFEPW